jgi:drug/metabolite transporter (DMT)-like permease
MPAAMTRKGYVYLFACLLLWSSFMLMARLGGKTPLTAYDLLALRLGTASAVLLWLPRPAWAAWRDARLWLLALIGCIGFCLLCYGAVRWVPAAHVALLVAGIQPFLMALLLVLAGQGWPQRAAWPGYAVMALGLGLLAWPLFAGQALPGQWLGDGMLLTAGVLWALYALLAKRWGYAPWLLTSFVTLASTLLYLPVYLLWLPKGLAETPWPMIVSQALFHGISPAILAMLCYLRAVALLGPSRVAALMALIPVMTGVAAVPLLNEPLTATLAAALLSVSLGAWWVSRPVPAPAPAARPAACGQP